MDKVFELFYGQGNTGFKILCTVLSNYLLNKGEQTLGSPEFKEYRV